MEGRYKPEPSHEYLSPSRTIQLKCSLERKKTTLPYLTIIQLHANLSIGIKDEAIVRIQGSRNLVQ